MLTAEPYGMAGPIAGNVMLVGEGDIEEIIETPSVVPVPGTKPWRWTRAVLSG